MITTIVLKILLIIILVIVILLHFSLTIYVRGGTGGELVIKAKYLGITLYPRPKKKKKRRRKKDAAAEDVGDILDEQDEAAEAEEAADNGGADHEEVTAQAEVSVSEDKPETTLDVPDEETAQDKPGEVGENEKAEERPAKKKRRKKDGEEKEKSKEGKPSSRNASLSRLKKITETEAGRAGLKHILSELVRLFRQCLPTRFSLTGRFGFSDPALTGQAAGFLITLMMTYPDTVDILPDFEKEILEGEFAAEGSVYGVYALVFLIRVLIHTEARQTILYLLRGKA